MAGQRAQERGRRSSSCLPRLKPGTVLLREDQGERLTLTVVPTGYLWRETAYASLLCDRGSRRRLCWV
jgi:hypothetical protein